MENTIIYLVGHAGTGKLTLAKALCESIDAKIVDNHYINNPVFGLLDMEGKSLPDSVWDYTDRVRSIVYETIETLSPKDMNFILTQVLYEDEARDHKNFFKLQELAEARGACFAPVNLTITREALIERRTAEGRAKRLKDTSEENAKKEYDEKQVLNFEHPNRLDLDVSETSASDNAAKIIKHIKENC